jgi:hypothetical protein
MSYPSYPTPYLGTIVSSPIRPSGPSESIATAFNNEIKGGHHAYETVTDRDSTIVQRREWGMLVTVYNDGVPDNNKTYQLTYGHNDTDLSNNNNWTTFNPLGRRVPTEWVDSVLDIRTLEPGSAADGDRYLVSPNSDYSAASSFFLSQDTKIAQYDSTVAAPYWTFLVPTDGMTLRVDSQKNVVYKYVGTHPSGVWYREYLNQVRYLTATSSGGYTYSASSDTVNSIDQYTHSVFYVRFGMTNSGSANLSVDSLSNLTIQKLTGNSLSNLSAGDLVPGNTYQLIYNGGILQTTIPTDSPVIGPAEDGDYTDGLFTDFTTSTPIGTAVDRFNEILKYMAPPSAPNLSSWSSDVYGSEGYLSFDGSTTLPNTFSTATQSTISPVGIGGTYSPSGYRLGIIPLSGSDLTGTLNSLVGVGPGQFYPAYGTYSIGNGITGSVSLLINGVTVSVATMSSTYSAIDTTSGGSVTGLSFSSATNSVFPSGYLLDLKWNRYGQWRVKRSDLVDGYNSIVISHDIPPSTSYVLDRYEVVLDKGTSSTSYTGQAVSLSPGLTKYLSGIEYYTTYNMTYNVTVQNVYRNTYTGSVAVTETTSTFPGVTLSLTAPASPVSNFAVSQTLSVNSGVRRYNQSVTFGSYATRTLITQPTENGGTVSISNLHIDTVSDAATSTYDGFDSESYRLLNGSSGSLQKYESGFLSTVTSISANPWVGTNSLYTSSSAYAGLQVGNGMLFYPTQAINSFGNLSTNPNFGVSGRDYTSCFLLNYGLPVTSGGTNTNYRTYVRYFDVGLSKSILNIGLSGSSFDIVSSDDVLTGNNIWFEIKLPYDDVNTPSVVPIGSTQSDGSVTGWMDAYDGFNFAYGDGDGCFNGTSLTSSTSFQVNLGIRNTLYSGGYVIVRITASNGWSGHIESLTVS